MEVHGTLSIVKQAWWFFSPIYTSILEKTSKSSKKEEQKKDKKGLMLLPNVSSLNRDEDAYQSTIPIHVFYMDI